MTSANAVGLFATAYSSNLTSLVLQESNGSYEISIVGTNSGCGDDPSWLTLDHANQVVYCINEGSGENGTLSSYKIDGRGQLHQANESVTLSSPVSGAIYGRSSGKRALALAHYAGAAVSSWSLSDTHPGQFELNQEYLFNLSQHGPNPDRQNQPYAHEAIVDPTEQYVIVPDLGADLVRVFVFDQDDKLKQLNPLQVVAGSGPRHATFYNPSGKAGADQTTYLFVVTELGNTVTSYKVTYLPNKGGLEFAQVYTSSTYGNATVPAGNAAAEVAVSPDNRFLVVSNRGNKSFKNIANPDPKNQTTIDSDSLATWALNPDGTLSFVQLAPSYGSFPRQFAMNGAGNLLAVGLQYGGYVVILKRDLPSGHIMGPVAYQYIGGQPTCVRWNEIVHDGTNSNPAS